MGGDEADESGNCSVRIVYLNTWRGRQADELRAFIERHAPHTDVFCLQELTARAHSLLVEPLADFREVSAQMHGQSDETGREYYAQSTFVRREFPIVGSRVLFTDGEPGGLGLATELALEGQRLQLLNYHGISRPKTKLDTPLRLTQSARILAHFRPLAGLQILGGDFNVLPETVSAQLFRDCGYRDLIAENSVPTTRSRIYMETRPEQHRYSDYIFTSRDAPVRGLTVPDICVSDHLPLILDLEVRPALAPLGPMRPSPQRSLA